jgi:colanic acid biosynthesis glycosyl transferase WcaI
MHLVFLNQYYPPDAAPTGVMLEGLVRGLIKEGHDVTVLCASGGYAGSARQEVKPSEIKDSESRIKKPKTRPCQSEASNGSKISSPRIIRIGATRFGRGSFIGKLLDYVSYYFGVAWHLVFLKHRPDRIVALTTPPLLSVIARIASKLRAADHAHWVMDLYPDVMVAHGMLHENGFPHRMLAGLSRWGFGGDRCAAVLTLGPDMAERTAQLMRAPSATVCWVPLWGKDGEGDPSPDVISQEETETRDRVQARELRRTRGWEDHELVVMYSGNMGLGHRFGELLAAAKALANEPVRFVFFGGGKRRIELQNFTQAHPECRIELHDYAPADTLITHLMSADVHVATLDPAWTGTMVPSKLQGVFSVGKPLIFIGSSHSSIGSWVRESGGGWVVAPSDVAELLTVLSAALNPNQRHMRGLAARDFAMEHFKRETNVARMVRVVTRNGVRKTPATEHN